MFNIHSISFEFLSKDISNMSLGLHAQEWYSNEAGMDIHQLYVGFFFFRIIFEFIKK